MNEKAPLEPKNESTEAPGKTPKSGKKIKKEENTGYIDRCIENPGFPWMVIAILFTLLVIMFWKDHFYHYSYSKMHSGNVFYREKGMMDDSSGPKQEGGMRMYREKIEDSPVRE